MAVYIGMTILAVMFSAFSNIKKYKNKKSKKIVINFKVMCWYISEIILIIVAAIRYDVGKDYMYTYVPYFNGILTGNINENIEIGFYLLNKLIQIFTRDYAWIFIVCSVIFFHYIYKAIREQSPIPTLSVFLLVGTTYYFIFLNTMRQMIAISIFLYAIKFIKERNFKKYLIYMLIAMSIHTSSVILIPIYFIYGVRLNTEKTILILFLSIILKPVFTNILLKILEFTKYNMYVDSRFDTNSTGYIVIAINVCVLLFSVIYYRRKKEFSKEEDNVSKEYSFYSILQLISTIIAIYDGSLPLLNRIRWGTGISIIILIPMIIKQEHNKNTRIIYVFMIVLLYSIYFLYTIGVKNANSVLPYLTIFQR